MVVPCCAVFPGQHKRESHTEAFGSELAIRQKKRRETKSDKMAMNRNPCLKGITAAAPEEAQPP